MALEAILLSRMQRLPSRRRQEWLRGLLLQGFREECQVLSGSSQGKGVSTVMSFIPRLHSRMNHSQPIQEESPKKLPSATPPTNKPFAALGKVIG
jgi:hypothetical protein